LPPGRRHLEDRQRVGTAAPPERAADMPHSGAGRRRLGLLAGTTLVVATLLFGGATSPAYADFDSGVAAFDGGDFTTAYNEWLPLAAGGDPFAQRNIGHLYRLGLGVPQDFAVAFNWYRRAADQGLVRAQANLANMLLRGQGVDQNPQDAATWFHRAASAGHAISQFNIGQMYRKGLAVDQDTGRALGWFQLAAEAGHERSIELVAIMTAEGIEPATDEVLLAPPFGAGIVAASPRDTAEDDEPIAVEEDEEDDPFASLLGDDESEEDTPRTDERDRGTEEAVEEDTLITDDAPQDEAADDDLSGGDDEDSGDGEQVAALTQSEPDEGEGSIIGGESEVDATTLQPTEDDLVGADDDLLTTDDDLAPADDDLTTTDDQTAAVASPPPQVAERTPEPLTRQPRISDEAMAAAVSEGLRAYQGKDYTTALRTWLPLAEAGNRDAQFYVGGLYMDGAGVAEDRVRAHAWWRLAADQGHGRASEFLEVIVAIMSAEQLTAAREMADQLKAEIR